MQSKMSLKLLLLLVLFTVNLFAIEGKIKVFIKNNDAIYTSQKITVSVELLSSAFSITDAKITFPASKKYIVQAPGSAAYLGQEEVEGEDWQMVHYDYEVYALQAGKIEIPSVLVSFTASMGYGQPKKEFDLKSDALHFDVQSPAGIKNNKFVLVTDNYALDSQIKPEKQKLIIGDAVELSITQKANNVPDILLRPIRYTSNAYLRVYDKEPVLKTEVKGKFNVYRTDSFTFVASGEGNVTVPAQEIVWWNSVTEQIQVETTPALSFEILPDPQIALDAKKAEQKERLIYLVVTLFFLVILYTLFASKIRAYLRERKRMNALSEAGLFTTLLNICNDSDTTQVYHHFYDWLKVVDGQLARNGFRGICEGYPFMCGPLSELEEAVIDPVQSFDSENFLYAVKQFREVLHKQQSYSVQGLIKNINPQ